MRSDRASLIEVRPSKIQGLGVFALRRIRKETSIIEYAGQRIDEAEAMRRYEDDDSERNHTFLMELDDDIYIDGRVGGNESAFINHSCSPNCAAYQEGNAIFIVAIRNIQPNVELTYDYRLELFGAGRVHKRLYVCNCGSPRCRGTLLKLKKKRRQGQARRTKTETPTGIWTFH
jgi:uncharacterized protein